MPAATVLTDYPTTYTEIIDFKCEIFFFLCFGFLSLGRAVLNTGFDEIVVESNLQVHNRVGSKNKSKIMLQPSNNSSTTPPTDKSARSLQVA